MRLFLTTGQRFQSHLKYWTIKAGSELAYVASVSAPVNRDLEIRGREKLRVRDLI